MRINYEGCEVTFETRLVTFAKVRIKGEIVAMGAAVPNPKDEFNEKEGQRIAITRALDEFIPIPQVVERKVNGILNAVYMKQYAQAKKVLGKITDRIIKNVLDSYYKFGVTMGTGSIVTKGPIQTQAFDPIPPYFNPWSRL